MFRTAAALGISIVAGIAGVPAAVAQHSSSPSSEASAAMRAAAGVAALGKRWDAEARAETERLYGEVHRSIDSSGIKQTTVSYGPDPSQTLDVFVPDGGFREPSVVLVYLPGGGLAGTERIDRSSPAYGNVGNFIARAGGIGVVARYRTLPEAKWPSGGEDVRLVLDWVRKNVAPLGGDPDNVLLMGNDIGATHIATYLFNEALQLEGGPGITGAVLSSGSFGTTPASNDERAYFGRNGAAHMPLNLVDVYRGKAAPILLWSGEYDAPSIETGVAQLYAKLCAKYRDCPAFAQLSGHNSLSAVLSIDTDDRSVVGVLIRFYHQARGPR
jgi:triacylglycerol lipase